MRLAVWAEHHATVCRKHPDLVAVYESRDGTLAILLRPPLVPLTEHRTAWFNTTRRATRAIVASLRGAGLRGDVLVLQWRPPAQVLHILRRWTCRYDADPARHEQLFALLDARLVDRKLAQTPCPQLRALPGAGRAASDGHGPATVVKPSVAQWYRDMASCWLAIEPPLRRRLILRTHRWIVGRILGPAARGMSPSPVELGPDGTLAWMLTRALPPSDLAAWRPWIRLVLADLARALRWPRERRNEAWVRWLFLIPYSIPVSSSRPVPTGPPVAMGW